MIAQAGIKRVVYAEEYRDLMGIAAYHDKQTNKIYVIPGRKNGPKDGTYLWQYELFGDQESKTVKAKLVRKFGQFSGKKEIINQANGLYYNLLERSLSEGYMGTEESIFTIIQHVYPELPAGKVGFKPGWYMASTDEIYIKILGKGGHGAKPDKCIDPILISAHLITALQQVASRWTHNNDTSVLTIGKIQGMGATNIIPDEVTMEGTFRTFNEEWRYIAHEKIQRLCHHMPHQQKQK